MAGHKISTHPADATIRVEHDGRVLAESTRALALEETGIKTRYYLPREDVSAELRPSEKQTHCPFKGDATYASVDGVQDAFWVYEDPDKEAALPVKGMLAPWRGRVDVFRDNQPV